MATSDGLPLEIVSVAMWRSTDNGETWEKTQVDPGSLIATYWFKPDEIFNDNGILYRAVPPQ